MMIILLSSVRPKYLGLTECLTIWFGHRRAHETSRGRHLTHMIFSQGEAAGLPGETCADNIAESERK